MNDNVWVVELYSMSKNSGEYIPPPKKKKTVKVVHMSIRRVARKRVSVMGELIFPENVKNTPKYHQIPVSHLHHK